MTLRFSLTALAAAAAVAMACAPAMAQYITDPFAPPPTRMQPMPNAVAWSPDGRFVAYGVGTPANAIGRVGVIITDVASRKKVRVLWHDISVFSVAWSPDGRYIASTASTTVRIWDAGSGKTVRTLPRHSSNVWSVAWSPDGRYIASTESTTVRIWDAANGKPVRTLADSAYKGPYVSDAIRRAVMKPGELWQN